MKVRFNLQQFHHGSGGYNNRWLWWFRTTTSNAFLTNKNYLSHHHYHRHHHHHHRFSILSTTHSNQWRNANRIIRTFSTTPSSSSSTVTSSKRDEEGVNDDDEKSNFISSKTDTQKRSSDNDGFDTLRRIADLSKPEANLIGLSAATLFITSSTTLILPTVSGKVIDMALHASQGDGSEVFSPAFVAFGLFGLTAVAGGGVYVRTLLLQKAGNQIVSRIKRKLFKSILSQDTAYFDLTKPGDIITRLTTDSQLIQGAVTNQAVAALRGVVMSIGSTVMLFQTSTTLAIVSLATLPPIFIAAKTVGQTLRDKQSNVQKLHSISTSTAEEIISGIQTVTQYVSEKHELHRYSKAVINAHNEAIKTGRTQALFDSAVHVGANGAILLVLGYGGKLVLDGQITAGDLTGFLMYSLLFAGNVSSLSSTYTEMMKAVAAADRVFEVIDREPSIPSTLRNVSVVDNVITTNSTTDDEESDYITFREDKEEEQQQQQALKSSYDSDSTNYETTEHPNFNQHLKPLSIEFRNISFKYPARQSDDDKYILGPNFSLKINPGEVLALVGGSGSGKLTVAALITRLYDIEDDNNNNNNNNNNSSYVDNGDRNKNNNSAILIDGHDIRDLYPEDLRNCIGIVSQEPLLFDGTIEENIRYGKQTATTDEIMEAARIAHVLDFVNTFPKKLQTNVGPKGTQLSGGQKQRIAIARLCVKDPPIIIFDEATSALDAQSEYHIKEAINDLIKNRRTTVISIAHRLSTIQNADRIAVLQNGLVAEIGTYNELVTKSTDDDDGGGVFRSLMGKQLLGFNNNNSNNNDTYDTNDDGSCDIDLDK